jgi:uncharacterized protein
MRGARPYSTICSTAWRHHATPPTRLERMSIAIRHDADARRFVADVGGQLAYLTYLDRGEHVLELDHTYVPTASRGGGIASQLTARALQYARERGYRVVPSCPFVAAYMDRHPEYRDLRV